MKIVIEGEIKSSKIYFSSTNDATLKIKFITSLLKKYKKRVKSGK